MTKDQNEAESERLMAKTTFTITGDQTIHCAGCERRIERALGSTPSVREVAANHEGQTVVVSYNPSRTGPEVLRERLEELGYRTG